MPEPARLKEPIISEASIHYWPVADETTSFRSSRRLQFNAGMEITANVKCVSRRMIMIDSCSYIKYSVMVPLFKL